MTTTVHVQPLAGTHSVLGKSRFLRPQWPGFCPQRTHKQVNTVVAGEPGCIFPCFLGGVSTLLVSCAHTNDVREAKVSIWFSFSLRPQSSLRSGSSWVKSALGMWIALPFGSLLFALLLLFLARCHV